MAVPMLSTIALLAIPVVGMGLALSQFCLVRSVLSLRQGDGSPARCLVGLSLAVALTLLLLARWHGGESMPLYSPQPSVVLGGLVFGMAARANGGCFVGTINGLCKGEGGRLFTVAGWVLGYGLVHLSSLPAHRQSSMEVALVLVGLAALLLVLNRRAHRNKQPFRPNPAAPALQGTLAWALMLTTGILVGLLHHSGLPWSPSHLARALGAALRGAPLAWSTASALLVPLGMVLVHGLRRDWNPVAIRAKDALLLAWGILMALGSVWGMGANDTYLFRYLPLGSLHAAVGLAAMVAGIAINPLELMAGGAGPQPAAVFPSEKTP